MIFLKTRRSCGVFFVYRGFLQKRIDNPQKQHIIKYNLTT